ncbi:MAG: hypothetical protein L0219_03415, partial [Phycisphaerales bacterium]|nr:hypothetical protein [Phycisphaerales bacterium]
MRSLIYEEWSDLTYDGHRTFSRNTEGHPHDVLTLGLPTFWTGCGLYSDGKRLPIKPIWPGFAINTILYAAILWLLFAAPGLVRRRRRIKHGLCPACAYPIGASETCTECGKPVSPKY